MNRNKIQFVTLFCWGSWDLYKWKAAVFFPSINSACGILACPRYLPPNIETRHFDAPPKPSISTTDKNICSELKIVFSSLMHGAKCVWCPSRADCVQMSRSEGGIDTFRLKVLITRKPFSTGLIEWIFQAFTFKSDVTTDKDKLAQRLSVLLYSLCFPKANYRSIKA